MADSKLQTTQERKYPVPETMVSILTGKINPLHDKEPMASAAHRWSQESSLLTMQQYKRLKNTSYIAAYFWPFCTDTDRYDKLVKFMLHMFIVDDHVECPYGQINRRQPEVVAIFNQLNDACDKVLSAQIASTSVLHVSAHCWKPYVLAGYVIYDTICSEYNDTQKSRFIQTLRDWYHGNIGEGNDIDRKRQFANLDEFFEVRIKSAAIIPSLQLIEYADSLFIPEDEWLSPLFQKLFKMLCRLVVICNDMYSFEKEVLDAGSPDLVYNCVTVLGQIDNISLTESMNQLVTHYNVLEKNTVVLANELMVIDWTSSDTRVWINHALTFIGGHWKVHTFLDRYHTMLDLEEFN